MAVPQSCRRIRVADSRSDGLSHSGDWYTGRCGPRVNRARGGTAGQPEDPQDMARAIVEVANMSAERWQAMSNAAYQTATSYTWDDATDRFEAALTAAANGTWEIYCTAQQPRAAGPQETTNLMQILADIALYVWPFVVLALFAWLPPRKSRTHGADRRLAVSCRFTKSLCRLFPTIPKCRLLALACSPERYCSMRRDSAQFRLRWYDLPMIVYCLAPLPTSLTNGLGLYDGVSGVVGHVIGTGMPYVIGRLYFRTAEDLRELAWAIFLGGVIYIPVLPVRNANEPVPAPYCLRFSPRHPYVTFGDSAGIVLWCS